MDLHRRWNTHAWLSTLQRRLSSISTGRPLSIGNPEKIKLIRGVALVLTSLALAWISAQICKENSMLYFKNTEWPPASTWKWSLQGFGFSPQAHLGDSALPLKTHPDPYSLESQIWITRHHGLIYLTHSPYQKDHEPELWISRSITEPNPAQWERIGSGLNGIHRLVEVLESPSNLDQFKIPSARKYIDPKEIRY